MPESPAGSSGKGCENNKSTSHDGDGTDDESTPGSDDEAPEDDEHQAGESTTAQAPAAMLRKPRNLRVKWKDQLPKAAKVPWNPMVICQSLQLHHQKRWGKTQPQKKPR